MLVAFNFANTGSEPMRILFSGYLLIPAAGGGNISALTLLRRLARKHEVTVLGAAFEPSACKELVDGVRFCRWQESYLSRKRLLPYGLRLLLQDVMAGKIVSNLHRELDPDLIIAESQPMIKPPENSEGRTLSFVRLCNFGPYSWYPSPWSRIRNQLFDSIRTLRNRRILQRVDLVLANSQFTADALHQVGIKAEVVYPFIDLSSYEVPTVSREFMLFVNPTYRKKGVEIVCRIAERLPNRKLLIVGNINPRLERRIMRYGNVDLRGWCDDMREVYKKTRIVLMPSIWEEPLGRVPVEAGSNGIPTVASRRGGLPESVGEGGILINDIWNIQEWVRAIKRLDTPETYREFSEKAVENSRRFGFERTFRELKELVDTALDLPEPL
jgi:glycosyltransferase involved in cell wall biosynthesis